MERPVRILVAKPGLDGHDRGASVWKVFTPGATTHEIIDWEKQIIAPRAVD